MTWDRFDKISQYFHANYRSQMPFNAQGKPVDKLYLIRPILDTVLNQIQDNYIPYRDVSVDEAMIAYRGRLSFSQYLPSKPTIINKTNDLILNLTPENLTQHSRIWYAWYESIGSLRCEKRFLFLTSMCILAVLRSLGYGSPGISTG